MTVFECNDITGRLIYLTKERFQHIVRHPGVTFQTLQRIEATLKKPLSIRAFSEINNKRYYYSFHKERKPDKYLLVLVKYLNGKGFIITSFYTNKIQGERCK